MTLESAFAACEETVRRHDPDRYFSALFAPAERRPLVFALYAFNYEIARIAETVREPMVGDIRRQWWREAAESARDGRPRAHDAVKALAELFARTGVPLGMFEAMIDARAYDVAEETFADMAAFEAYADATSGGLMRIAARVLGAEDRLDAHARELGIAYALTGFLRSIPFHASRYKLYLPLELMRAEGISREDIFAGHGGADLKRVMAMLAYRAHEHLRAARTLAKPERGFAALLPAATSRAYLKFMANPAFDPFATRADLPLHRRQFAMLVAALRGRV